MNYITQSFLLEAESGLQKVLSEACIKLSGRDFVAGGVVRDTILRRNVGDIDLYKVSPLQKSNEVNVSNGFRIDIKYVTSGDPMDTLRTFAMSLCQCAYSVKYGFVLSTDFLRTIGTGHVTIDPNIPNWNEEQSGRSRSHHYDKIKARFTDYTFDPLPFERSIDREEPSRLTHYHGDYGS